MRRWTLCTCKIPICPPFLVPLSVLLFPFPSPLSSHPPFPQFIFQFAPRSSQVCARRKFTEAAGAPSEATLRRDKRVTISPSPPSLYLPLFLSPVSAVTSLPGYTGPQGDLILARVPRCRSLSSPSSPPTPPLPFFPPCRISPLLPSPPSFPNTSPRGTTARPSSPELSISGSVYLRRDSLTHLECIFTSVHTPSLAHSPLDGCRP